MQIAGCIAERMQGIQGFLPAFAQDGGQIHSSAAETALLAVLDALDRGETLSRHRMDDGGAEGHRDSKALDIWSGASDQVRAGPGEA